MLHPEYLASIGEPGTANMGFLYFTPYCAVIRDPDFCEASITTIAWLKAAIILFLCGKRCETGSAPKGYSVSTSPDFSIHNFRV
jgi:hypothetical protein